MPATKTKRNPGKRDIAIYQAGMAKDGGRLNKAGIMLNVPKNVSYPGSPLPKKATNPTAKGAPLGEQGRGIIQTLKNRTAIEENKQERLSKKK